VVGQVSAVRSAEWLAERRDAVTSTDIPVLLGLSPYKSEARLAREKTGEMTDEPDERQERLFRLGLALENVIRSEDQLEHGIKLRRVNRLLTHPKLGWAKTSLDFERVGARVIVEAKVSRAARWDDGLPQDVEAQARWQMGVAGYPRAHVAALRFGTELACFDLEHNEATFDGLVTIAADFRRRLAEGGPFAENAASVRERYPADNGTEVIADQDTAEAVVRLIETRGQRKALEEAEEALEVAIKTRLGEAAVLYGEGFKVTWRRTKDRTLTDWPSLAQGLLAQLSEAERDALIGLHSRVEPGFRPFRVVAQP